MYTLGLIIHNLNRWLVIATGLLLVAKTIGGWRSGREWQRSDERLYVAFIGFLDFQFLVGIALYAFLSPLPAAFFADIPVGMKVPTLRFFMLDHVVSMLIGIAIIHNGRTRSVRAPGGRARLRIVAVTSAIGLALILASIPWAGLRYGRPLFRLPGTAEQSLFDAPVRHQPDERHEYEQRLGDPLRDERRDDRGDIQRWRQLLLPAVADGALQQGLRSL